MTTDRLDTLAPLVGIIAREATKGRPDLYEDARQEGLIAAWRVFADDPDAPRSHGTVAARSAIRAYLRGRPTFGGTGHQGRPDAFDRSEPWPDDLDALGDAPDVETRLVVRAAVAELPPEDRALVFRRFWADAQPTKAEHNRWRAVRVHLRETLKEVA